MLKIPKPFWLRVAALALAVAGFSVLAAAPVVPPVGAGADWPSHGGGVDESSYSRLNQIALRNVSRLGLAWSLDLPDEASLEAIPLAVDCVLYFTGRSKVYAVDGSSGKLFVVRLFGTLRGLD